MLLSRRGHAQCRASASASTPGRLRHPAPLPRSASSGTVRTTNAVAASVSSSSSLAAAARPAAPPRCHSRRRRLPTGTMMAPTGATTTTTTTTTTTPSTPPELLIIGATGVTGRAALDGLLAAGVPASSMLALTRSASGAGARAVAERGIPLAQGDLDSPGDAVAALLAAHPNSLRAVYVHALSADAATADPRELERARRLVAQLAPAASRGQLEIVLYNSSAGRGRGSGVSQIEQKHAVEDILAAGGGVPLCALQASMFYEELWKKYTRPAILSKGKFAFTIPPDVPVHLVAARDLGTAAAAALRDPARFAAIKALPLAGDALTPTQLCEAFSRAAREEGAAAAAAGSPPATAVTQRRFPPLWLVRLLNKDLYRIVRFLSSPPGYGVDVAAARAVVPGLLTFDEFLRATGWADPSRTYEQGVRYDFGRRGVEGGAAPVAVAAAAASNGDDDDDAAAR